MTMKLSPTLAGLAVTTRRAPVPMALFDSSSRLIAASPSFERLTGLRKRRRVGLPVDKAWPDAPPERLELHRRAAAGEHLVEDEESYVDLADQTHWMSCEYRPLPTAAGANTGYFVHAHDVTPMMEARREAQAYAERLGLALGAAHAGVCELDLVRKAIWCSPEFEEIVGVKVDDFYRFARDPWWMAHPEDKDLIAAAVAGWTDARHEPLEFRIVLPNGETRWVQSHGEQQCNAEGRRTKIVGLILDIDARKRQELALVDARRDLQQNAERLNLALDAARAGVFETDFKERTFWCSPEFEEIAGRGLTFEEAAGIWPMTHPEDREALEQAIGAAEDGRSKQQMEWRLILPNGQVRWIDGRATVHFDEDGQASKVSGLVLDIDARKQQELALMAAEREAQAAAEAKSQFLANMSHEIRTPMNGVLGVLHLLQAESLSDEGRNLLREAVNCGRMLSQLLDDVIDFSRIEAGRLELSPEPIHPGQVLDSVVGLLRPNAEAKGLALTTRVEGEDAWIHADPVRLRQALFNLIGNAVKFTSVGGVEVRLKSLAQGGRLKLRFEIEDTGVGIPEAVQETLFRRFQQADGSTSRRFGGSGLGLAITRRLAELMEGEVGFTSREGQGSTFWFEIAAERAEAARTEEERPTATLDGLRVLLVEDNATNRLVASKMLEAMGLEVDTAEDGKIGVEAAQTCRYDLILMDVQMPVMDGIEATRCIRRLAGEVASTPIIGLTANAMAHQRKEYLDAGMDGVVAKPISPADLIAEMIRVLSQSAAPERAEAVA